MVIRELQIRYALKTANGFEVIHGIICGFCDLKYYIDRVKECGYRLVGIDERFRKEDEPMPLSEGWHTIHSWVEEEKVPEYGYLSFG